MRTFYVGDKIRIKKTLNIGEYSVFGFGVNDIMIKYKGQIAKITKIHQINNDGIQEVRTDLDKGRWRWSTEWFEPLCKLNRRYKE